jgi:toxin ParE1/3/4
VAVYRFSPRAEADLLSIATYTLQAWGAKQAAAYLNNLEACCGMLADNPALGRNCDEVRAGLRRMGCGRHVVFYREATGGIRVSRILHQRMLPERHSFGDD